MKSSKKILAILVSVNFLFSSIAFGTGTSKLESVYLSNVAQYMPMKDKITLEQVNKHCDDSLKMGYAYDFLRCYILLNTLPKDKYGNPILSNYSDFEIVAKAFKNSIAYYSFKSGAKITDIPEQYRTLCRIEDVIDGPGIFFPRVYNLSTTDVKSIVKLYNGLNENIEIQREQKDFIKTHIFNNREFTTSEEDISNLTNLLNTGLLLNLQKLERDLHDKLDYNAAIKYICTMFGYFSSDIPALIDSAPRMSDITSLMLGIDAHSLTEYEPSCELQGQRRCSMGMLLSENSRHKERALIALQDRCGFINKENIKEYLRRIEEIDNHSFYAILREDIQSTQNIRDLYQTILTELKCSTDLVNTRKTEYEVFKGYLNKKGNSLSEDTMRFLYLFFCENIRFDYATDGYQGYPKACNLREIKNIIDELVKTTRIIQTDFNDEDIEYPAIHVGYLLRYKKDWFEKKFTKSTSDKRIRAFQAMFPLFVFREEDDKIDLDALQTVVYIMHKIGCSEESIDNMYDTLIKNLHIDEPESLEKINKIFNTVGKGQEVDLSTDLGTTTYRIKSDDANTPLWKEILIRGALCGALGGTLGVALGYTSNLLYNGVKKYKNTSETKNISKHKNNKNINKSCRIQ